MSARATAVHEPAAPVARSAAGWMVLAIEDLRLALPQRDVRQIEIAAALRHSTAGDAREAGRLLHKDGKSWPAYCLDGTLHLLWPVPSARRVCVFFESEDGMRGLLCDHVWSLAADGDLGVEPAPGCMAVPHSPVAGFARFQGGVAVVTNATALASYLYAASQLEHVHVKFE